MKASVNGSAPKARVHQGVPRTAAARLKRHDSFLQLLQLVAVAANGAPTALDKALQTTLDEVCARTGWTLGHALLSSSSGDELVSTDIWHERNGHADADFSPFDQLSKRVFETGQSESIADARIASPGNDTRTTPGGQPAMLAMAAFPIVAVDKVVGVLQFYSPRPFDADPVLRDVMVQVGLVLGRIVERVWYEDSLRRARAEAETASEAKSEFLSHMSHELRTPLTAILGYAELLQLEGLPEKQVAQVMAIEQAGEHLLRLVNDVLHVSSRRAIADPMAPVSVAAVVRDACLLLQPLAQSHNVTLRKEAPAATETFVMGDRQGLMQIMMNLLANGIKYNVDGGEVLVSTREIGSETVRIEVSDTGHGISEQDLNRIFVPFERLAAARARDGSGLGLGIARDLAEKMGGVLEARSTVGAGSTFSIVLPNSPLLVGAESPVPNMTTTNGRALGRPKVLYVEDNIANIDVVQEMFARLRPDIELITTMKGTLAVDLARVHAPQLILLDVHLPDIQGGEVLRRLKTESATQNVPVAALSADVTSTSTERMLSTGAIAYLTKPIRVKTLLELLDEVIGKRDDAVGQSVAGRGVEKKPTVPAPAGHKLLPKPSARG